jgi:hypothetical protein
MPNLAPIAPRLARLVRLLGSDKPGEVAAAVAALRRTLGGIGADLNDFGDVIENGTEKPKAKRAAEDKQHNGNVQKLDWYTIAVFCQHRDERLLHRERMFINDMASRTVFRDQTKKQQKWLWSMFLRLGGKGKEPS